MLRLLVILACAASSVAHADGDAKAKAFFEEGRALIEAADKLPEGAAKSAKVSSACDKFATSLELDAQLGTMLNLADCRVREGKLADAYTLLEQAVAEATRTHDREAFAKQQLAMVAAKVARITVRVKQPELDGLAITVGGRALPHAQWGKPIVVTPGTIPIHATATGRDAVDFERSVAPGGDVPVDIAFEPVKITTITTTETKPSRLPYYVAGGGAVLIAGSIGLALHARSRYTTARDANDMAGVSSAQHEADAGTVVFIGGAVAVGIGIYLYVRERSPPVTPVPTSDGVSLVWSGKF